MNIYIVVLFKLLARHITPVKTFQFRRQHGRCSYGIRSKGCRPPVPAGGARAVCVQWQCIPYGRKDADAIIDCRSDSIVTTRLSWRSQLYFTVSSIVFWDDEILAIKTFSIIHKSYIIHRHLHTDIEVWCAVQCNGNDYLSRGYITGLGCIVLEDRDYSFVQRNKT